MHVSMCVCMCMYACMSQCVYMCMYADINNIYLMDRQTDRQTDVMFGVEEGGGIARA